MNDVYKQALADVHDYGVAMGWTHEAGVCDLFVTLSNMADLDDDNNLEDDIRPAFVTVWNSFGKLLAIADGLRNEGV